MFAALGSNLTLDFGKHCVVIGRVAERLATSWKAEKLMRTAAGLGRAGRYHLEAATQSIHAARAKTGKIDWQEIALLYEGLVRFAPNIGASVGRAVALAQAGDPSAGLDALAALPQSSVVNDQRFWAARGHLCEC